MNTKTREKRLQVLKEGKWTYVFCHSRNEPVGLITTENRLKAVHGKDALIYFQRYFADHEFRLEA